MEFLAKRNDFYWFQAKKTHFEGQVRFLAPECSNPQIAQNHGFWLLFKAVPKATKTQHMLFLGYHEASGYPKVIKNLFFVNVSAISAIKWGFGWFDFFIILLCNSAYFQAGKKQKMPKMPKTAKIEFFVNSSKGIFETILLYKMEFLVKRNDFYWF